MYHGIINVYKEAGFTSFDVVAKMRGICGQKKIGHTGTLDPDAEGVLPVCLGKATKVCDMLTNRDKIYETTMLLGIETDTQDTTGTVLSRGDISGLTEDNVRSVIRSFIGKQKQIPPMYSALKVDGKKLCDLARAGITVERTPRDIEVYEIQIKKIDLPRIRMTVHCSKGTYIRTLCHDIGQKLGCGAAMEHLLRVQAAGFVLQNALKLAQIQELKNQGRLAEAIIPVEQVFASYPKAVMKESTNYILYNGNKLLFDDFSVTDPDITTTPVRIYDSKNVFQAVYLYDADRQQFKPEKMFLEVPE